MYSRECCDDVWCLINPKVPHPQTKQGRGLKGTRKSYKAERNGKGGGARPSKHKEERRRQM